MTKSHEDVIPDWEFFHFIGSNLFLVFWGFVLFRLIQAIFWLPKHLKENEEKEERERAAEEKKKRLEEKKKRLEEKKKRSEEKKKKKLEKEESKEGSKDTKKDDTETVDSSGNLSADEVFEDPQEDIAPISKEDKKVQ